MRRTARKTTPNTPAKRTRRHGRRGTIIVLALAVLAIIAIAALSYVSIVRIDRNATSAVASQVNFQRQVNGVAAHIGALIGADLHGGKIVTNNVPKFDSNGNSIWPRFFEDGETWDYPFVDLDWVADPDDYGPNGNSFYQPSSTNLYERIARPEEAWLASTEPRWTNNPQNTVTWPQITNLRSGLNYYPRDPALSAGWWVRGDGRYVDLLDWFEFAKDGRGNPGLDLLARSTTPAANHGQPIGPEGGAWNAANSGDPILTTEVFGTFMSELETTMPVGELTNTDQRMWIDTDGDLRPDARWTQLPEVLGNLQGLNWVVAARIIDASGLANYNSHIEFNYNTAQPDRVSTGQSPADFDLIGLLQTAANTTDFDQNVVTSQLGNSFQDHLEIGLGFSTNLSVFLNTEAPYPVETYNDDWTIGQGLTRAQRLAHYSYIGNSPANTEIGSANYYRDTDLIDLRSYWTTNSRALSRIEERLDGPEAGGFLPGKDDNGGDFGVLRAREDAKEARHFDGPLGPAQPDADRMRADVRRLLMPVTGEGLFSPIPIANPKHPAYSSNGALSRIILPRIGASADAGGLTNEEAMDILSAYTWALLPEAALDPVYPDSVPNLAPIAETDRYYGGGINGPAEAYRDAITTVPDIGAAYPFLRAAASTVNLIDAMDDEAAGGTTDDVPTLAHVFNRPVANTGLYQSGPHDVPASLIDQGAIINTNGVLELNTVFPWGTVDQNLLPQGYVGTPTEGFTVVGTERTPFLVEAACLAVYHDSQILQESGGGGGPDIGSVSTDQAEVDTAIDQNFLGCIIAIELGNPWPDTVDVQDFRIELTNRLDTGGVNGRRLSLDLAQANDTTIPPGGRQVFNFLIRNDSGTGAGSTFVADTEFENIRSYWESTLLLSPNGNKEVTFTPNDFVPDVYDANYFTVSFTDADLPEILHALGDDEVDGVRRSATIQLIRKASTGDVPFDLLVDRLSPPTAIDPNAPVFPEVGLTDAGAGQRFLSDSMCSKGSPEGALRIAFLSSIHRPDNRSALGFPAESGFPAYVVEDREQNTILPLAKEPPIGIWWHVTPPDTSIPECVELSEPDADNLFEFANMALDDLTKDDFEFTGTLGTLKLPPFQLFVPDAPLKTKADLLMVSAFATTYYNDANAPSVVNVPDKAWVRDAWDAERITDFTGATPVGGWLTLSEQLAQPHNFLYRQDQDLANPYFGVLDPTRWNFDDADQPWPQQRAPEIYGVTPAIRLLDCFEAIDPIANLVEGRININSAPDEILRHIPFLSPRQAISTISGGLLDVGAFLDERIIAVQRHRDRRDINGTTSNPWTETNLPNFRRTGQIGTAQNQARGFTTAGELALLDGWEVNAGEPTGQLQANPTRFAELGNDGQTDGLPLEMYAYDATNPPTNSLDEASYAVPEFNPVDDPEERTAIYRGMANTVTARSDIFMATFVLRGYDPAIIDGIRIADFGSPEAAMDSEEFFPTYESRWLAVFDRSNIVTPTDRPRLLKLIELPVIKP